MQIFELIDPVADRILVEPIGSTEERKQGGIVIPATAQDTPQQGFIRRIGPGKPHSAAVAFVLADRSQLKAGQRILFGKFAGTEITVEGVTFLILREEDVLAILHERPEQAAPDPAIGQPTRGLDP